jgi:hypothetical protein
MKIFGQKGNHLTPTPGPYFRDATTLKKSQAMRRRSSLLVKPTADPHRLQSLPTNLLSEVKQWVQPNRMESQAFDYAPK